MHCSRAVGVSRVAAAQPAGEVDTAALPPPPQHCGAADRAVGVLAAVARPVAGAVVVAARGAVVLTLVVGVLAGGRRARRCRSATPVLAMRAGPAAAVAVRIAADAVHAVARGAVVAVVAPDRRPRPGGLGALHRPVPVSQRLPVTQSPSPAQVPLQTMPSAQRRCSAQIWARLRLAATGAVAARGRRHDVAAAGGGAAGQARRAPWRSRRCRCRRPCARRPCPRRRTPPAGPGRRGWAGTRRRAGWSGHARRRRRGPLQEDSQQTLSTQKPLVQPSGAGAGPPVRVGLDRARRAMALSASPPGGRVAGCGPIGGLRLPCRRSRPPPPLPAIPPCRRRWRHRRP